MAICNITLRPIKKPFDDRKEYCQFGTRLLFKKSSVSPYLGFLRSEFFTAVEPRLTSMSISGAQPKLSLAISGNELVFADTGGEYILKPSPESYPFLAENEHAIMCALNRARLFSVAQAGLVQFKRGEHNTREFAYLTKRYDRVDGEKIHQEQLDSAMGVNNKYGVNQSGLKTVSYAQAGQFILANLGLLSAVQFFQMVVVAYMIGNNDLHLRNVGIVFDENSKRLSPVYDMLSVAPYPSTHSSCFLALPLLICEEEGENKEAELAPGMDSAYGAYTGHDFMLLGEQMGLKKALIQKHFAKAVNIKPLILSCVEASPMPIQIKDSIASCIRSRSKLLAALTV